MLPATDQRVPTSTSDKTNAAIAEQTRERLHAFATQPEGIPGRLSELEFEWDVERTLEANAATLALVGTMLGAFVDRWFLAIPIIVTVFLLQHALQGWCPPLPILRALGFRTSREIAGERTALKALRGDFEKTTSAAAPNPEAAWAAVQN
jgi:hypothetical protein